MSCDSCGAELPIGAAFCPRCGKIIVPNDSGSHVSPYDPTLPSPIPSTPQQKSSIPPTPLAVPSYEMPLQNPYEQPVSFTDIPPPPPLLRTRLVGRTLPRVLFYLWGVFWLVIGVVGYLLSGLGIQGIIPGISFIVICVAGIVILIFLLRSRKQFQLNTPTRLLFEIGLTLIGILVFLYFLAIFPPQNGGILSSTGYVVIGSIFVIFGLITAFVAFW